MALRPIPENAIEIQPGLWAEEVHFTFAGVARVKYNIYSAEGYCFWNTQQPENYDEYGDLLPLEQRVFAQYASTACRTIEQVNENFISVPVQDGYEIVSTGRPSHEIA